MRRILYNIAPVLLAVMLTAGCTTTGKTLSSIAITVDEAMKGWATWVANGYATPEQEVRVKAAYVKYQAAMKVAEGAYVAAAKSGDKPALNIALDMLNATKADLLNLVSLFMKGEVKS